MGSLMRVVGQDDLTALLSGNLTAGGNELGGGHTLLWSTGAEVDAQLGADHHQRICHVVAAVAKEGELLATHITNLFLQGQDVCQHLRGVELVGEAVPHGHARLRRNLLNV